MYLEVRYFMVNMEKITINVPVGMSKYINVSNKENELIRNALLLDEAKGRAISNQMGFNIMGTIGIIMAAFQENELSADDVLDCIHGLQKAGRYISQKHYQMFLDRLK
jgi:predicted nucleic acid-binding protein